MNNVQHSANGKEAQSIRTEFMEIAIQLENIFPELDLRFNLQQNSKQIRYKVAAVSSDIFVLDLDKASKDEVLHEAIFTIKHVAQIFDA
jgi:hypothetical protein